VIFVTVGAQMPFDRLIRAVDTWAESHPEVELFAQVGVRGWQPAHMPWLEMLTPSDFRARVQAADLLVSHVGMGSILTALQYGKPLLALPRLGHLKETRNDHQVATAKQLASSLRLVVAWDTAELTEHLDRLGELRGWDTPLCAYASPSLVTTVRQFIQGCEVAPLVGREALSIGEARTHSR